MQMGSANKIAWKIKCVMKMKKACAKLEPKQIYFALVRKKRRQTCARYNFLKKKFVR